MTKIALILTEDREKGTKEVVELLGINPVNLKNVILKPNFNTADTPPGSTAIENLQGLIPTLKDMGALSITLAERSGPVNTRECMEEKGIFKLAEELDFSIVNLAEVPVEEYVHLKPKNSHWENGFLFAKLYHEAECIVETCCLKTHRSKAHFTLSIKNAVGMVPRRELDGHGYMREMHNSPHIAKMIAEINSVFNPDLIVLDGVTAFVDGGPATGTRIEANIILAGTDRVAIDAVGIAILRILGTNPHVSKGSIIELEQIARAVELGIGISSLKEIEILTKTDEAEELATKIILELNK